MLHAARLFSLVLVATIGLAVNPAAADNSLAVAKVRALDRLMASLAAESARDAALIRELYEEYLEHLMLDDYAAVEGALMTGGLVPLPPDPLIFNLAPRLDGDHPIGEKDLTNQASYVAARPAMVGMLLDIARRVPSSPVEITSLVRHSHYQDALRITNANATTTVPMHTMGLAVDIALINTPLQTAYELRDVLRQMREAGDLLFIAERQQLVFHVVPHPSRLGYFNDVYDAAMGGTIASRAVEVVATAAPPRLLDAEELYPRVRAEVVLILPAEDRHWDVWFAEPEPEVEPEPEPAPVLNRSPRRQPWSSAMPIALLPLLGGLVTAAMIRGSRGNGGLGVNGADNGETEERRRAELGLF